ncbi:class I SAM-dependent methyltransferase [Sphingomonas immobilis]|uniref:Class I SAM-dependent methyltransferase n=1 Tax=Sphingomonas immobilis TaxID=3063997 RepID=A0ABT9A3E2_9SPHN|nr:class I SAM-dependent methyltransferase [Sphingomonas sp. CA1-15]MDO7844359.1 class I SAM-dependent methyltransferase [Sphingomonas sp. CA1-15]
MEQAEWAGTIGDVWAEEWRRTDRSFAGLATALNAAIRANALAGARTIADIGCGAGVTSIATAQAFPDAQVTGLDISLGLVAVARERSHGIPNLSFVAGDAPTAIHDLAPVDLIVSRHGVMFFDDPVAAFAALRSAMTPGGRLVFSCFRSPRLNGWASWLSDGGAPPPPGIGAPGPFAFADEGAVTHMLAAAGWGDAVAEPVDYRYRAGEGEDPIEDAVSFFTRIGPTARALRDASPAERAVLLDRMRALMAEQLKHGAVDFDAAAWIWTARA